MPRPIDRNFDQRKPLLVRRQFKSAGRTLSPGESFDWQRLSVDVRRVRLLYESGYLGHVDDAMMPEPTEASAPTEASEPKQSAERDADLEIDSLAALQNIATAEGAPIKTSKAAQREAIIELRNSRS